MKKNTGLADPENFRIFSEKWRQYTLSEAGKWCKDEKAQTLLAEAALADVRRRFLQSDPPGEPEYYLRGQICLIYSYTGENTRKLENYLAEHAMADAEPAETPATGHNIKTKEETVSEKQPEPEITAPSRTFRVKKLPERPRSAAAQKMPEQENAAQPSAPEAEKKPVPATAPNTLSAVRNTTPAAPVAEKPTTRKTDPETPVPEKKREPTGKADTFYDPNRTALWIPGNETTEYVTREISLPDEEEEETKSVFLSFFNTILFVMTLAAFGFLVYETGLIQHLFS